MKSKEFIAEDARRIKYEVIRCHDEDGDFTNTFVARADGEEIGRFEGKSRFDSGEASEAARKCCVQHRAAAINKEDKIREHEYQYNKPLTDIDKSCFDKSNILTFNISLLCREKFNINSILRINIIFMALPF